MTKHTRQQQAIADAFHASAVPLSIPELVEAARTKAPTLGQATAYRARNRLLDAGELRPVKMPGEPVRYEPAGERHHHFFKCNDCGELFEVDGCDALLSRLVPPGFTLEAHEVALFGRCRDCGDG